MYYYLSFIVLLYPSCSFYVSFNHFVLSFPRVVVLAFLIWKQKQKTIVFPVAMIYISRGIIPHRLLSLIWWRHNSPALLALCEGNTRLAMDFLTMGHVCDRRFHTFRKKCSNTLKAWKYKISNVCEHLMDQSKIYPLQRRARMPHAYSIRMLLTEIRKRGTSTVFVQYKLDLQHRYLNLG